MSAVDDLVKILAFRATMGRPCYIKFANTDAALIVPHLTDGAEGPYSYLRTFRRFTVDLAVDRGLVVLGPDRVEVPPIGGTHWSAQAGLKGRTIALAHREEASQP